MTKQEIICPRCQQINTRSSGSHLEQMLTNPKYPELCTICQTDLKSGERLWILLPIAWTMWFAYYMMYVIHYTSIFFLFSFPIVIITFAIPKLQWMYYLILIAVFPVMFIGIWKAEKARRRGELLLNKRK